MLVKPISLLIPSDAAKIDIDQHVSDAKSLFAEMRNKGSYKEISDQMVVYRITDANRSYTGVVLGLDASAFRDDTIVHHESTIPSKVAKQAAVAREQGGFSKPILLTNRAIPAVSEIINRYTTSTPLVDIYLKKYSAQHQIWPITTTKDLKIIAQSFSTKEKAYIVDGHHRTKAIEHLSKEPGILLESGLCAMFDIGQLDILPFHRIVDLNISAADFLGLLEQKVNLESLEKPRFPITPGEVVLLLENKYYSFRWPLQDEAIDNQLDVNLLSKLILKDILQIEKESTSSSVQYIEGDKNLDVIISKIQGTGKAAFLLQPIDIDSFIDILNEGEILPPKSTFFLPRMANGIISMTWEPVN